MKKASLCLLLLSTLIFCTCFIDANCEKVIEIDSVLNYSRSTFSPIFTSGKLKLMMQFIANVSEDMTNEFRTAAEANNDLEVKETLGKYSMDTIASCAFGVHAESFSNENSKFVEHAKDMFR